MNTISQDPTSTQESASENTQPRRKMFSKGAARAGIPQRKVRYRLYPNATQSAELQAHLALHCRLYNTALSDRITEYAQTQKSLTFADQTLHLTRWRKVSNALHVLNAQSEQVTLRRVDLAFQSFFRRVKAGAKAVGFPRFKSLSRYHGWGYSSYGNGWSIQTDIDQYGNHTRHPRLYLQGVTGTIQIRGKSRNQGTAVGSEILYKQGKWYISITMDCPDVQRSRGSQFGAFDINLGQLLTIGTLDTQTGSISIEKVDNPRWLRRILPEIQRLNRSISRKQYLLDKAHLPRSNSLKAEMVLLARLLAKVARIRKDFLHKLSARLVAEYAVLGTEVLNTAEMLKNHKKEKKTSLLKMSKKAVHGLHRELASIAPATLLSYIHYKAEEAGTWYDTLDTRQLKPTQRCHGCWSAQKKTMAQRRHQCECGIECDRDDNAVAVMLRQLWGNLKGVKRTDGVISQSGFTDYTEPSVNVRLV